MLKTLKEICEAKVTEENLPQGSPNEELWMGLIKGYILLQKLN